MWNRVNDKSYDAFQMPLLKDLYFIYKRTIIQNHANSDNCDFFSDDISNFYDSPVILIFLNFRKNQRIGKIRNLIEKNQNLHDSGYVYVQRHYLTCCC